jgi:hypothetical protein
LFSKIVVSYYLQKKSFMGLVVQLSLLLFICIGGVISFFIDEIRSNVIAALFFIACVVALISVLFNGGVDNKKEL